MLPIRHIAAALVVAGSLTTGLLAADAPQVKVTGGLISGTSVEQDGQPIHVFKGIPFAAPPVGDLRWRPPQPVIPWEGVRTCVEYAPACPQPADGIYSFAYRQQSEDCLCLNVWTESLDASAKRPVMVWIHGGGNLIGGAGNPAYDGRHFAQAGVVLVSIQYRLGAFGYLAHPALTEEAERLDGWAASGNYGLMDQIAALKWVQENAAQFGGDPQRVTIFGESAGAANVTHLMASPLAKGLFHRAIAESGYFGEHTPHLKESSGIRSAGEENGRKFAERLDVTETDAAGLEELRKLPAEKILSIPMTIGGLSLGKNAFQFGPVVDGYVHVEEPHDVWAAGKMHPVPLIAGSNLDDGSVFSAGNPIRRLPGFRLVLRTMFGPDAARAEELFPAKSDADVSAAAHQFITIMSFRAPARRLVRWNEAAGKDAWLYHFSRNPGSGRAQRSGVFHGLEIIYVFGNAPAGTKEVDRQLSADMRQRWVNFAASGDPNGEPGDPVCKAVTPKWPVYRKATDEHLEFGDRVSVGRKLDAEACDLVDRAAERRGRK